MQRVSGFGFGIFIMTVLPALMPSFAEATTLSGMLSAAQSLYVLVSVWRLVDWRRLIIIMLTFLLVSYFAVQYVSASTDAHLKHLLGIVLILMSIYFLIISNRLQLRPTVPMQISMGALSGIMGGLFAMQGPPAVLYFVATETDKNRYLALSQTYFFIGNSFLTLYRAQSGFLTPTVCRGWIYAIVGVVVGSVLGKLVFDRISVPTLRKVVYGYMAVSGVMALMS